MANENNEPKQNFIGKLKSNIIAHKSLIAHYVLVISLLGILVWQVLDFFTLSTNNNIKKAIKTNHMIVYDLLEGKFLDYLPSYGTQVQENHADATPAPAPEIHMNEVAVILSGIGKDSGYLTEIAGLPAGFIYSYSPYGAKPLEHSMEMQQNSPILAEITFGNNKFDINEKNSDFRNLNAANAAISKIYSPIAIYISATPEFAATTSFTYVADELDLPVVISSAIPNQKENIVAADVFVKTGASPEDLAAALAKLEEMANSNGYALGILEPSVNNVTALKLWVASLPSKNLKLTSNLKN